MHPLAADGHHSNSAGAGLAAAGAIGAGTLMLGGAHGSASGSAAANAPAIQATPTVKSTPGSVTTFSPVPAHPVATPVAPYVTVQPPALVITTPLHRRVTTTSVVIPTPYTTATALQVHYVDRGINDPVHTVDRAINATTNVTQGILPASAVDRGIISDGGNHTTTGAAPEPAPGLILVSGILGLGALAFIRRRANAA